MTPPASNPDSPHPNYGRVGRVYQLLEYVAFGRTLQRSREAFLEQLGAGGSIAIFGAGDGRCFEPLLLAAPRARIDSLDVDPNFIAIARGRVQSLPGAERINFILADAREWQPTPESYDAVITHFFLDCFTAADLERVVEKVGTSLRPGGIWLFADFSIPFSPKWANWRARAWVFLLCTFFRWRADHPLRSLPPMQQTLHAAGFTAAATRTWSHGLVRAAVYRRDKPPAGL